jgi:glycosyltransferase involved in cell wall biosynthesis
VPTPGDKALRILLVVNRLDYGGAEFQLIHLSKGLAGLGHEVTVCCIDRSVMDLQSLREAGVEVVELRAQSRPARLAAVPRLARLARRADVVHCTMWDASLWGRLAAILARRPVVVADHATDRSVQVAANGAGRGSWIATHNRLLDRFTFATVACASTQRPVLEGEGVAPRKIVEIANGVPIDELVAAADSGLTRSDLGIPEDAAVAVHVAGFRAEKNQMGALEAFVGVRARVGDVHLVFLGSGPLRPAVEARTEELGAGDWVHFLGFRDDVAAVLSLADVMVLPSTSDAMPMTVLEAMALGVPVVATDVGDVSATLEGGAGICVPVGDREAFERACVELLSDGDRRAELARAGRERVRGFDAIAMAEHYSRLLTAADEGRSPQSAAQVDPGIKYSR